MPAAAVIPAPIAYIKVVAVKKLVVDFLSVSIFAFRRVIDTYLTENFVRPSLVGDANRSFY